MEHKIEHLKALAQNAALKMPGADAAFAAEANPAAIGELIDHIEHTNDELAITRSEVNSMMADAETLIEHAAKICESRCAADNGEDEDEINAVLGQRAQQIRGLIESHSGHAPARPAPNDAEKDRADALEWVERKDTELHTKFMANRHPPHAAAELVDALQACSNEGAQPIETIEYWASAYATSMGGGHGMVVKLLREYVALRRAVGEGDQADALSNERIKQIYRDTFNSTPGAAREAPHAVPQLVVDFARAIIAAGRPAAMVVATGLPALREHLMLASALRCTIALSYGSASSLLHAMETGTPKSEAPAQPGQRQYAEDPMDIVRTLVSAELLPCPFCGSAAHTDEYDNESLHSHAIVKYKRIACSQCDMAIIDGESHDEVIATWNRREPAQAQGATIPDGWCIERSTGGLVVQKPGIGGYWAERDTSNIASSILFHLASDLLAQAHPATIKQNLMVPPVAPTPPSPAHKSIAGDDGGAP